MADLTKGSLEDKAIPGLTLTPASVVVPADERTKMYAKLKLGQEEIDFLESPYKEKFLTRFEIGKDAMVMYGSPVYMAGKSDLIKTIISYDPPYVLAKDMIVYGGALIVLWLHINGYPSSHTVEKLSLAGWLNFYDLVGYFGVADQMLHDELTAGEYIDRVMTASDQELLESIIPVSNLLKKYMSSDMGILRKWLDHIATRVNDITTKAKSD